MELFETYFEVANESDGLSIYRKIIDFFVPNYRKGLKKITEEAKDADTYKEAKKVLERAEDLEERISEILKDRMWRMTKERFKTIWWILFVGAVPTVVMQWLDMIMDSKYKSIWDDDYINQKIKSEAQKTLPDIKKLVKLLRAKVEKLSKQEDDD